MTNTARPAVPVPAGLLPAMDVALESNARMRPEHICGVLDWLHAVLAMNTESFVALSVDELVLVAHALGDAMGAPIHEINTEHVRNVLTLSPPYPEPPSPYAQDIPTETLIEVARASGAEVIEGELLDYQATFTAEEIDGSITVLDEVRTLPPGAAPTAEQRFQLGLLRDRLVIAKGMH